MHQSCSLNTPFEEEEEEETEEEEEGEEKEEELRGGGRGGDRGGGRGRREGGRIKRRRKGRRQRRRKRKKRKRKNQEEEEEEAEEDEKKQAEEKNTTHIPDNSLILQSWPWKRKWSYYHSQNGAAFSQAIRPLRKSLSFRSAIYHGRLYVIEPRRSHAPLRRSDAASLPLMVEVSAN
ncbi:hypothetical protein ACOMHN_033123 [Nucella lapillus]